MSASANGSGKVFSSRKRVTELTPTEMVSGVPDSMSGIRNAGFARNLADAGAESIGDKHGGCLCDVREHDAELFAAVTIDGVLF